MKFGGLGAYVRENWGAPFLVEFMVLLMVAAGELSVGSSDAANNTAVIAFYFLIAGVVLQIGSYLKFGERDQGHAAEVVSRRSPKAAEGRTDEYLAVSVLVMVVLASGAVVSYNAVTFTTVNLPPGVQPLSAGVSYTTTLRQPDGSMVISFGITAFGGTGGLRFSATWSDGFKQNSTTGTFTRTFVNQTLPTSAQVLVVSGNGETAFVTVDLTNSTHSQTTATETSS